MLYSFKPCFAFTPYSWTALELWWSRTSIPHIGLSYFFNIIIIQIRHLPYFGIHFKYRFYINVLPALSLKVYISSNKLCYHTIISSAKFRDNLKKTSKKLYNWETNSTSIVIDFHHQFISITRIDLLLLSLMW